MPSTVPTSHERRGGSDCGDDAVASLKIRAGREDGAAHGTVVGFTARIGVEARREHRFPLGYVSLRIPRGRAERKQSLARDSDRKNRHREQEQHDALGEGPHDRPELHERTVHRIDLLTFGDAALRLARGPGYGRFRADAAMPELPIEESARNPESVSCPIAAECGGCARITEPYVEQLAWKTERVRAALARHEALAGVEVESCLAAPEPWRYRNRAKLAVAGSGDDVRIGLYQRGTNRIVDLAPCMVQRPVLQRGLERATLARRARARCLRGRCFTSICAR
jgi:hypothetical protein